MFFLFSMIGEMKEANYIFLKATELWSSSAMLWCSESTHSPIAICFGTCGTRLLPHQANITRSFRCPNRMACIGGSVSTDGWGAMCADGYEGG